jgi:hypothetical protein
MTRLSRLLTLFALALAGCSSRAADPSHPVVVELFQSQGCSTCPPADANLQAIADRPGVIALSFAVTYWDDAHWKDTFASPAFTARQWDYAHAFGRANVFTPEVVVDGAKDGVGVDAQEFARLVASGRAAPGPTLALTGDSLAIGAGAAPMPADVWLVRYDPRTVQVAIRGGENGGKTLPHKNIVKQLTRIGTWTGRPVTLRLTASADPVLKTAVLVQLPRGGPILAAAKG